jgi:uncharacterized protein (TIGR00288 family)
MAKVAVCIDLTFFLIRYARVRERTEPVRTAEQMASEIRRTALSHLNRQRDELYRIFIYDCRPLGKKAHHPITKRSVDFARTPTFAFRTELLNELIQMRKVALRLGELADRRRWRIRSEATRKLLDGSLHPQSLEEGDVTYDVEQKGVDIKMALDIAALAYKRLVDRIVLITGDADFVPAAKLARREGIDVILDALWATIAPSLNEHIDGLRNAWPRRPAPAVTSLSA